MKYSTALIATIVACFTDSSVAVRLNDDSSEDWTWLEYYTPLAQTDTAYEVRNNHTAYGSW